MRLIIVFFVFLCVFENDFLKIKNILTATAGEAKRSSFSFLSFLILKSIY